MGKVSKLHKNAPPAESHEAEGSQKEEKNLGESVGDITVKSINNKYEWICLYHRLSASSWLLRTIAVLARLVLDDFWRGPADLEYNIELAQARVSSLQNLQPG